ncbi:MAG: response regulator transcription factor [Proteobacteria bacterium]|nr:response regulator transcription factor [Pseudomonadota bacterium]MBU4009263.1 response regulator transcription factor [Pseudomonadota bacterium]
MSDIRILVVDDEEDITELIRYNLVSDGYTVKCAYSGEEAVKIAMSEPFDLIVLDLMLPRIGGIDVAKRLRSDQKTINIPIIMLTAKSEEADVLSGLELADDYVTKPFSPKILSARISAVLRRKIDASTDSYDDKIIIRGDIQIHTGRRRVEVCGEPVELSFSEFQILIMLSKRPGWVFSRSQIVDTVHGEDYPVTDRSVDVQIVGLRKKLGSCGHYIETVRSVGYRFKEKL